MDDTRVLNVWSWCSEAYLRHGRKLSLPAGTDPAKTYQWRYVNAIARKFEEWELTDEAAQKFIDIAVQIAKEKGLLNKGLAVLHQANMLSLCYDRLLAESDANTQNLDSLRYVRSWLLDKCDGRDLQEVLLRRPAYDGFCHLTLWYKATRISTLYLALSRACNRALARLNRDHPDERSSLPTATELWLIRDNFLKDSGNVSQARLIFEEDWRETCLLPS